VRKQRAIPRIVGDDEGLKEIHYIFLAATSTSHLLMGKQSTSHVCTAVGTLFTMGKMESAVRTTVLIMSKLRTINFIEWGNVMLQERGNCNAAEGKEWC
jgi:hypothetical protein